MPAAPITAALLPGPSIEAAACADVVKSSGGQSTPTRDRASRCSAINGPELFVRKTTRSPAERSAATASAEPGMARPASQTTPSRSTAHVTRRTEPAEGLAGAWSQYARQGPRC